MDHLKNIDNVSHGKATKFPIYILYEQDQPDTDLHCHEFVELVLIKSGTAIHQLDNSQIQLQRGDVFVVPRNVRHRYINGTKLELINILYIPEMIPMVQLDAVNFKSFDIFYKGLPAADDLYPFMHLPEEDFQELEKLASALYEENFYRHNGFQFSMLGLFMTLLARIMRLYKLDTNISGNNDELGKIIAFMHSKFRKKITLKQLCRITNMSRSTLMRYFTRAVGVAPLQYQLRLRISEAMQLLQMTNKSLGDIAFELGFSDSNYFGRQFKKAVGISPLAYRKNFREQTSKKSNIEITNSSTVCDINQ